jgi:hypothetical protein
MVIVYAFAALISGFISCALLWPYGAAIALLSMPFGGSLFAIVVHVRASTKAGSSNHRAAYMDQPQKLQITENC